MNVNSDMIAVARAARTAVARSGLKTAKADKFAVAYISGARGYTLALYGADSDAAAAMGGLYLRVSEGGASALDSIIASADAAAAASADDAERIAA